MGIEIDNESTKLLRFYKQIVASLEAKQLNKNEMEALNEFYIKYQSVNDIILNQDEFLKYMYLGWYIYKIREDISRTQSESEGEESGDEFYS
jgi:hypothetical protein